MEGREGPSPGKGPRSHRETNMPMTPGGSAEATEAGPERLRGKGTLNNQGWGLHDPSLTCHSYHREGAHTLPTM